MTAEKRSGNGTSKMFWTLTVIPVLAVLLLRLNWQYQYPGWSKTVSITGSNISLTRSKDLIFVAHGNDSSVDVYKSLGWMHAHDRYVQLFLFRLSSQGRLLENFPYSEMSLKIDMLSKQYDFEDIGREHIKKFPQREMKILNSYVEGINEYMSKHPRPLEFVLLNYFPRPFTPSDVLGIQKFITYAGLDEICLGVEKILIESITQSDVDVDFLKDVFSPHLVNLDDDLIEIYKSIKDLKGLEEKTVGIRTITNSNNWVVNGNLSVSGLPIMSSDPHQDVSTLPNMLYESHYIGNDGVNVFGVSVPGLPIYLMGRNTHVSYSLTFGMMDMADYFIENIKDGKYERDGEFIPLISRSYNVGGRDVVFYDTKEHHRIERQMVNYDKPLVDGKYLAISLHNSLETEIQAIGLSRLPFAMDVFDAKEMVVITQLGSNFLFSDTHGNIAYQQCGMVPRRPTSNGFTPLPAWKSENIWKGYLTADDYHSIVNPPEGFLATANNHIQDPNKPCVSTFPALPNRVNRITDLLQSKSKFSIADMMEYQSDTYSLVAERIVPILDPFLPNTDIGNELRNWDFRYRADSKAAALFYKFFNTLTLKLNSNIFPPIMLDKYAKNMFGLYTMYKFTLHCLDTKLETFHGSTMTSILNDSITDVIRDFEDKRYGDYHQFFMNNMLFAGKLPSFLGLDFPPTPVSSGFEVLNVGVRSDYMGKPVFFGQTWRFITDMATRTMYSILPGGPSGNVLSNIYGRDIEDYLNEKYKTLNL